MKPIKFRAVFEPSIDGYWVYFPELPGCISWGENIEKAREGAREALSLHLYGILKDGEEIECAKEKFQIDPMDKTGNFAAIKGAQKYAKNGFRRF